MNYLKIFALASVSLIALATGGCATINSHGQPNSICKNKTAIAAAANVAIAEADLIADPVKREAALGAARTTLAYIDTCP